MPGFFVDFQCMADACDNDCCRGWRIDIDKNTFNKYKQCQDTDIGEELRKKVLRVKNTENENQYGKIEMNDEGDCPFLNVRGLCSIQLKFGEEMLSNTCRRYPRVINSVDGVPEITAQLSCPTVARAALLPSKPMSFSFMDMNQLWQVQNIFNSSEYLIKPENFNKSENSNSPERSIKPAHSNKLENTIMPELHFTELRKFGISVLQNRAYTVPERLILLGMFFELISGKESNKNIIGLIQATKIQHANIPETKKQLESIGAVPELQLNLLNLISSHKRIDSFFKYRNVYQKVMSGLGITDDDTFNDRILENFIFGTKTYFKPFMAEQSHVIENVLVHEYFKMMMPFGSFQSVWDSYIYLMMIYGLIKFYTIGIACKQESLNTEDILLIVQLIAGEILHNRQLIDQVNVTLRKNGLHTLAYMAVIAADV